MTPDQSDDRSKRTVSKEAQQVASLTIDELDEGSVTRLRSRGEASGHSVEEEAICILRAALGANRSANNGQHLLDTIRAEFGPLGGVELDLPPRERAWEPPRFQAIRKLDGADMVRAFRDAFGPLGGVELDIPARTPLRAPHGFDE